MASKRPCHILFGRSRNREHLAHEPVAVAAQTRHRTQLVKINDSTARCVRGADVLMRVEHDHLLGRTPVRRVKINQFHKHDEQSAQAKTKSTDPPEHDRACVLAGVVSDFDLVVQLYRNRRTLLKCLSPGEARRDCSAAYHTLHLESGLGDPRRADLDRRNVGQPRHLGFVDAFWEQAGAMVGRFHEPLADDVDDELPGVK